MNQQGYGQHQGGMSGGTSYGQGSSSGYGSQGGMGSSGHEMGGLGQHGMGSGQQGGAMGGQYGLNQGGQHGGFGQGGGLGHSGSWSQGGMHGGGMQGGMQGGMHGQQQQGGRDVQFNPHTMDKDYNLVSVLYHSLQAADTCAKYCEDARREGSPEIAHFMEQVQQQNLQISQRAKELLMRQRQI